MANYKDIYESDLEDSEDLFGEDFDDDQELDFDPDSRRSRDDEESEDIEEDID